MWGLHCSLAILYLSLHNLAFSQYQHNGSATKMGNSCYVIQWNRNFISGSVWRLEPISFRENFDLHLSVMMGCSDTDGDGLVFGFQDIGTFLGNYTGHMGYAGLTPSLGIEIDTHQDPEHGDPAFDHMAVVMDGNLNHRLLTRVPAPVRILNGTDNIEDCSFHDFRITWNLETKLLKAYFDCELRITVNLEDLGILGGYSDFFWGITAGTTDPNVQFVVCPEHVNPVDQISDTEICGGQEIKLHSPLPGIEYVWSPGISLSDSTIRNPIAHPNTTTLYKVVTTDSCGLSYQEEILVHVIDSPLVNFDFKDTLLCAGESLYIDLDQPGVSYSWSHGPEEPTVTILSQGLYKVTLGSGICESIDSFHVSVMDNRPLNLGIDTTLCEGASIVLRAPLPGNYLWQDGSNNRDFVVHESGEFSVQIENRCGSFAASRNISFINCIPLYIPNSFTPNGDGINDTFLPYTDRPDVEILQFSIFDRWGKLVYSVQGVNAREMKGWDGDTGLEPFTTGVFTYRISSRIRGTEPQVQQGSVTLIR